MTWNPVGPMPNTCARCHLPVVPAGPGVWLDQARGTLCYGNPATPHVIADAAAPSPRKGSKLWLVLTAIGVVMAGLITAIVVVMRSPADPQDAASKPPAPAPASTSAPAPVPGGSVPCDPDQRGSQWCFPADAKGGDLIARIKADSSLNWPCYTYNDPKAPIDSGADGLAQVCLGKGVTPQNYSRSQTIGYDTEGYKHDPKGVMTEVDLSSTVSYVHGKQHEVGFPEAEDLANHTFSGTVKLLWPNRPDLQQQATDAFKKVKQQCDSERGGMVSDAKAIMPAGYSVTCSPASSITTTTADGTPATVLTASAKIESIDPSQPAH